VRTSSAILSSPRHKSRHHFHSISLRTAPHDHRLAPSCARPLVSSLASRAITAVPRSEPLLSSSRLEPRLPPSSSPPLLRTSSHLDSPHPLHLLTSNRAFQVPSRTIIIHLCHPYRVATLSRHTKSRYHLRLLSPSRVTFFPSLTPSRHHILAAARDPIISSFTVRQ
jgi:hypothetical protein